MFHPEFLGLQSLCNENQTLFYFPEHWRNWLQFYLTANPPLSVMSYRPLFT